MDKKQEPDEPQENPPPETARTEDKHNPCDCPHHICLVYPGAWVLG